MRPHFSPVKTWIVMNKSLALSSYPYLVNTFYQYLVTNNLLSMKSLTHPLRSICLNTLTHTKLQILRLFLQVTKQGNNDLMTAPYERRVTCFLMLLFCLPHHALLRNSFWTSWEHWPHHFLLKYKWTDFKINTIWKPSLKKHHTPNQAHAETSNKNKDTIQGNSFRCIHFFTCIWTYLCNFSSYIWFSDANTISNLDSLPWFQILTITLRILSNPTLSVIHHVILKSLIGLSI